MEQEEFKNLVLHLTVIHDKGKSSINQPETHIVPVLPAPIRLQEYGVGIFMAAPTKSALKKALKKKFITVDGVIASTATYILGGEHIRLSFPEVKGPKKKLVLPLEVLFEDDHLAIINKPAGVLVSGNSFKTIANALVQNIQPSSLPDATKPQPVHRLDFATTGILLIGKTHHSIRVLNKMFADKVMKKKYHAVTIGTMDTQGTIASSIDGKQAKTFYRLRASVPSMRFTRLNLVELTPQTGRRHQIRKHLASIGHPILGDKTYGTDSLILHGKGLYLHAFSLGFTHPVSKEAVTFTADLPLRFRKLFA